MRISRIALLLSLSLLSIWGCAAQSTMSPASEEKQVAAEVAKPPDTLESVQEELHSCVTQSEQALEVMNDIAEQVEALRSGADSKEINILDTMKETLDSAGVSLAELVDTKVEKKSLKELQAVRENWVGTLQDVLFELREFGGMLDDLGSTKMQKGKVAINANLDTSIDAVAGALASIGGKDEEESSPEPDSEPDKSSGAATK